MSDLDTSTELERALAGHVDNPIACIVYGIFAPRSHALRSMARDCAWAVGHALFDARARAKVRAYTIDAIDAAGKLERDGATLIRELCE